ncbi:MAG TPA: SMP-30/gluconolactonase/LRE family protein [Solimonas sp.]|nr:SMP-30/gluconolactonase/LRE family protein [Solimonas sp.]
MKKILIAVALLAMLAAYLLLWPVPIRPVAWTPAPAPSLSEGPYASNDKLKGIEKIAQDIGIGPEGIAVDAAGRLYAGFEDGRVARFSAEGKGYTLIANTGGRPLGTTFGPNGGVVVADAIKGLLLLGGPSEQETLSVDADGQPYGFVDDADNTRFDKNVYFTDASTRFGVREVMNDVLEHGDTGRLLRYNVETRETTVLMKGLHFPNGVAVGPDDAYVLVNETFEYRIWRYWLKGDKAGTYEIFADNLPGFPDNLSFNDRDRFWVAIYAPRTPDLDRLLPKPDLRKIVARLPQFLRPSPVRRAFVLGFDLDGHLAANLQYQGGDAYAPITSVEEHKDWLYFGSLSYPAMGRIKRADVGG